MASAAKASGNGSLLWPEGCESIADISWELSAVIQHAYRILNWQENLSEDEMPPVYIWPFEEELELHFERVDKARKDKYGGSSGDDDDGGTPMMSNELADKVRG